MIYLDTSVVVALLTPEALSPEARRAAGDHLERLLQGGVERRCLDRDRFRQAAAALGLAPALG